MTMQTRSNLPSPSAASLDAGALPLQVSVSQEERLSALFDGECTAEDVATLTQAYGSHAELQAAWMRYEVLGQALRSGAVAPALGSRSGFVAGVMAAVQSDGAAPATAPASTSPPGLSEAMAPQTSQSTAANDDVFRWKMVAGLASVVAVATLVWLGAVAPITSNGPQLALQSPNTNAQAPVLQAVVTERGVVLRDPQLDELMAAHRQYGGMSALQMPAGFLRNATYDIPQR
jgi:sigma-E factor negative regulatory protein RseA